MAPPDGHAAVVVEDWEASSRACSEAGYEVSERPPTGAPPAASCAAPGGHRVELMAAPPS